jgi:serine/threonine protein kinase
MHEIVSQTDKHHRHYGIFANGAASSTNSAKNGALPNSPPARRYLSAFLKALQFLHEKGGFAHRDINPENVLVCFGFR